MSTKSKRRVVRRFGLQPAIIVGDGSTCTITIKGDDVSIRRDALRTQGSGQIIIEMVAP